METSEDCNNIINHVSEVGGHLRMDRAVGVVPDFLDNSFDGAGCPYWNSAVTDRGIIQGLIGVIWGFSELRKSHEIII